MVYFYAAVLRIRGALHYVESARGADGVVVVVHLAQLGFRFYGERLGVRADQHYVYVRSVSDFERVVAEHVDTRVVLVTTLHRALRTELPELHRRIEEDWQPTQRFRGTLGDGDIVVWTQALAPPSQP